MEIWLLWGVSARRAPGHPACLLAARRERVRQHSRHSSHSPPPSCWDETGILAKARLYKNPFNSVVFLTVFALPRQGPPVFSRSILQTGLLTFPFGLVCIYLHVRACRALFKATKMKQCTPEVSISRFECVLNCNNTGMEKMISVNADMPFGPWGWWAIIKGHMMN